MVRKLRNLINLSFMIWHQLWLISNFVARCGALSSACLRAKTICSSVNRDFFIGPPIQRSIYHAGILFLNGAGFWVRVT